MATPDKDAPPEYRRGQYDARRKPFLFMPLIVAGIGGVAVFLLFALLPL